MGHPRSWLSQTKSKGGAPGVLEAEVFLDEVGVASEPVLELAGRFDDVHSAQR